MLMLMLLPPSAVIILQNMWKTFTHTHTQKHIHQTLHEYSFAASLHNWQTTLNINVFMQLHSEMFIRAYYAREIIMKQTIIVISLCVFCVECLPWPLSFSFFGVVWNMLGRKSERETESGWTLNYYCLLHNNLLRVAHYYRHWSKCKTPNLNWWLYCWSVFKPSLGVCVYA